ncbi:hypothetical protein [Glaciihabitans sp. dw_435]|uniref:hypothetical protein n=1 Tax=Glaciihabitans sp. dw_435 TaxID=2720081 RepID=UPI001BD1BF3E|nr:hypothetical protein [Glaciihabitans sp. dw_435]
MTLVRWHRPLLWLAALMTVLAVFTSIAALVDHRQVTGVDLWLKPLKFALSIGIYAVTLSWLIGQLQRFRRIAWIAGTVSVVGLLLEMVIIVGVAAVGETSHFNVSTPLHTTLWSIMATSIVVVWMMTFLVSIVLFRNPMGDRARTLAIRAGAILALVGMALAFLMTGPTAQQLDDFQGIAGAHAVGVEDGGPGLPLLGWSTVAGDLRIPHFVGMHALQVIPIIAIVLALVARRVPALRSAVTQRRLVAIAAATYSAVLVVLTWQALRGQSIVRPDGLTIGASMAVFAVAIGLAVAAVMAPGRPGATTATATGGELSLARSPRSARRVEANARRRSAPSGS